MCLFVCFWHDSPHWARVSSFTMFLDHTQRRDTVCRTPLDVWSVRHRDLYLTTHKTHNRQTTIPPVGFEPTISAGKRPQTYALDRAATGTGVLQMQYFLNISVRTYIHTDTMSVPNLSSPFIDWIRMKVFCGPPVVCNHLESGNVSANSKQPIASNVLICDVMMSSSRPRLIGPTMGGEESKPEIVTVVTGFDSGLVGTVWHWDRLLSDPFDFTGSVSFLQYTMLDFICAVSVPGGAGGGWSGQSLGDLQTKIPF